MLENIWITDVEKDPKVLFRLKHMKKLKHVAFGRYPKRTVDAQDYES